MNTSNRVFGQCGLSLIALAGAVLLQIVLPSASHAAPGDLDPTFGTGGIVITDFGSADNAFGVAIQVDGKIVAAGNSGAGGASNFVLSRYNADGSLDATFDGDGKVTTAFPGVAAAALAVAIQADGKIVAVGGSTGGAFDFDLARYNADGSLDSSFGSGGRVTTDFGKREQATGVKIQADGKIVAAGFACTPFASDAGDCDIALARYHADGSLDSSFGIGGKVMTGPDRAAQAVAIQADGKIVTAGFTFIGGSSDFLVARFNSDGSLDSTFGSGGLVTTDFAGGDGASGIAIQADGKILAVGGTGSGDFGLARYTAGGSLDMSFGAGGKVTTDISGFDGALASALQTNGKIVAAGFANAGPSTFIGLARYDSSGGLDPSFGSGGKVTTDFAGTASDVARAVAIQADGKIVAAGEANSGFPAVNFLLARYLGDLPNQPPVADAGPNQTIECTSASGTPVTLDGTGSSDPDGDTLTFGWSGPFGSASGATPTVTLGPGTHVITLTVNDGNGGTASETVTIAVQDTTAPNIGAVSSSPDLLWPPNHQMVPVAIAVSASDACSVTTACQIVSVSSNEPIEGLGDGDTAPDWQVTGALSLNLRAERSGKGSDRVYTVTVQCTDASGNSSTKDVLVNVPHDRRK